MALQSSGAISLNDIHIEAGGSSGTQCSINDSDIRALISKSSGATMSFSEWYGASAALTETLSNGDTNVNVSTEFGSSNFTSNTAKILIIASGSEIGATGGTGNRAITVPSGMSGTLDIQNSGTISGAGGPGGTSSQANGSMGGSAIFIASNGVTVTNSGTIRGGGGGGGKGADGATNFTGGGNFRCQGGVGGNGGNGQGFDQSQSNGVNGTGRLAYLNYLYPHQPGAGPSTIECNASNVYQNGGDGGDGGNYGVDGGDGGNGGSQGGSKGKYIQLASGISYSLSNTGTLTGNAP